MEVGQKFGGVSEVVGSFPGGFVVALPLYEIFEAAAAFVVSGIQDVFDFVFEVVFDFDRGWWI